MIDRALVRLRLPREAGLIVGLFVAFRLMMLIALRPDGLTFFGDTPYYYELAQLSDRGLWPYLHYWMEYPPVFPFLSTLLYRLIASGGYDAYVLAYGTLQTLFGAGSLMVLMRLASRLHGESAALRLGWVYAALFTPLIIAWWHFDTLMALCLLIALDRLIDGRDVSSAIAVGLGVMVKIIPGLILPAVALARPVRRTVVYAAIVILVIAAILAPLYAAAPDTTRVSVQSLLSRSSYQTVWALIDGNLRTGLLGGVEVHLDNALATQPVGNPSGIPDGLKLIAFGALYLAIVWRIRKHANSPYGVVAVMAITFVVFALWSSGWSPQWQVVLIPLVLLAMPDGSGIGFVLIFGAVNLVEYPLLISRGLWEPVIATILLKTLLLLVLLIELVRRCQRISGPGGQSTD